MEPIDEYLDKVLHYLKEVSEKDAMVTEGIQILKNCEERLTSTRIAWRDKHQERKDQLKHQSEDAKKLGFETEQLAEQVKRLTDSKVQNENELRTISTEINQKMAIEKSNFQKEMEALETRRNTLDDTIQRKLSTLSNRQN